MSRGIRVKFVPDLKTDRSGSTSVPGGTLTLVEFGSGTTAAQRDAPKPATIVFHGAYLDHARKISSPDFTQFASLEGQIVRRGPKGEPVFLCDPEVEIVYDEPEPENGEPFRELRLDYDGARFDEAPEDGAPATRLRLPLEPDDSRFFELGVELQIAGATEGELDSEHRLDVPLPPKPGPIFEWPDALGDTLPLGLTLILEEGGKKMALDWKQGELIDDFRRFTFSKLKGTSPCTLTAQSGERRLKLLDQQIIADPAAPIRWTHFLEEFAVDGDEGDDEVRFTGAMPEITGTV